MHLTPAQLQTLKTHIVNSSDLNVFPNNSDGNAEIVKLLDLPASPDFWVWRTLVTKAEYVKSTSVDGTTFSWTGAGFITRSQGERDAWREIFSGSDSCNPSLANVRQAFMDIFSGAIAPAPANRTHLSTVSRRKATRLERLFATGTGSTGSPGLMVVEGSVDTDHVQEARNLP